MADLTIVGKTTGIMQIAGASPDGVNIGIHPINGAGINQFATAAYLLEEAAKQEIREPQSQNPGPGYSVAGFRAASEHQIVVISFDGDGGAQLDLSAGVRPTPATLFGLALACRTQASFIMQQALVQGHMAAAQQQQALRDIMRPS
jgi:hypothetical protein